MITRISERLWSVFVVLAVLVLGLTGISADVFAFRAPDENWQARAQTAQAKGAIQAQRILPQAVSQETAPGALLRDLRDLGTLGTVLRNHPTKEEEIVSALLSNLKRRRKWLEGVSVEELRLHYMATVPDITGSGATVYVQFVQQHEGRDVDGSYANFIVKVLSNRSAIMSAQARLYPDLSLPSPSSQLGLSTQAKAAITLGLDPAKALLKQEKRLVRYIDGKWRRVREVRFAGSEVKAVVDEDTSESWIEDDRLYSTIHGRVSGRGDIFDPLNPPPAPDGSQLEILPLQNLSVSVGGSVAHTDSTGAFNSSVSVPATVTANLKGWWASVTSETSPDLSLSAEALPGTPVDIRFNPTGSDESSIAQVNGYYHTNFIHGWLKERLGTDSLPEIDIALPVRVNFMDPLGGCNASYSPMSRRLTFYKAVGSCLNSAYDTVIYHEYGHFVDDMAGGVTNGGLSEGWGDVLASYATGQPCLGEGLLGDSKPCVRTADNDYQYPSGWAEVHDLGQAWAGFAWHLRQNLIYDPRLSREQAIALSEHLIISALLANSRNIPWAVFAVLILDDDDGDLSNGTPHMDAIVEAAARHSIPILEDDTTPPSPVNDLAARADGLSRVVLTWTATGDDGMQGKATAYDIRYALSPIADEELFDVATPVIGEIAPRVSGSPERMTVAGLMPGNTYYFAVKVIDNMENASFLSNSPSAMTQTGAVIFSDDFEEGALGWISDGLWHLSQARSSSPVTSQAYNNGTDYDTGSANKGSLVSPSVDLTDANDAVLLFKDWFRTEDSDMLDVRTVEASVDGGFSWLPVKQLDNDSANRHKWIQQVLDISAYAGRPVRLRFTFDTKDSKQNNYEGWYVDDVKLIATFASGCSITGPTVVPVGEPFDVIWSNGLGLNSLESLGWSGPITPRPGPGSLPACPPETGACVWSGLQFASPGRASVTLRATSNNVSKDCSYSVDGIATSRPIAATDMANPDFVNKYIIFGFAFDLDYETGAVSYDIFVDGSKQNSSPLLANTYRPDVRSARGDVTSDYHGWGFVFESELEPGRSYNIRLELYDLDAQGNKTGLKQPLTQVIQVPTAAYPVGYFDGTSLDPNYLQGWSWDPDDPTQPLEVRIVADGQTDSPVIEGVADLPRDIPGFPAIGNHGFRFPVSDLPGWLRDGENHTLEALVKNRIILGLYFWAPLSGEMTFRDEGGFLPPSQPEVEAPSCKDRRYTATIRWSGTEGSWGRFNVDLMRDEPGAPLYYKAVSARRHYTRAPSGFDLYPTKRGSIRLEPGVRYKTRVYNGKHSPWTTFEVPRCDSVPLPTCNITGPPSVNVGKVFSVSWKNSDGLSSIRSLGWSGPIQPRPGSGALGACPPEPESSCEWSPLKFTSPGTASVSIEVTNKAGSSRCSYSVQGIEQPSQTSPPIADTDMKTRRFMNKSMIFGWAFDPDRETSNIRYDIYVDNIKQNATPRTANGFRPDVSMIRADVTSDYHGWSFMFSPALSPGEYTVRLEFYDVDTSGNETGNKTPLEQTIAVQTPAYPIGYFDGDSFKAGYLTGWSWDPDDVSASVEIRIIADGDFNKVVATGLANRFRKIPGYEETGMGNHGFRFSLSSLPSWIKDGSPHTLHAWVKDLGTNAWIRLGGQITYQQ